MNRHEYARLDATALAGLIRRREVSEAEVLAAAREAIAALNPEINAVIALIDPPAAETVPEGAPFRGVPFLLKDIGAGLAGVRTTCASRYVKAAPPQAVDDELTRRFMAAGLTILGKSNLPELGFNVTTEPVLYGPTRNPWNLARSAGGSSGGAAAAVASGMVPIAHATDGAGSIRIPAAACGLVGLKPSRGAVPQGPAHSDIYGGLVAEGVITRTVRDQAQALAAVWGADEGAPYGTPGAGITELLDLPPLPLRIGMNRQAPDDVNFSPEALETLERAGRALEALGHHVFEVTLPLAPDDLLTPRRVYLTQTCAQAAADAPELQRLIGRPPHPDEIEAINLAAIERGRAMTAADYLAAVRAGHDWTRRFARLWEEIDVLLTPALVGPAPSLGSFPTDHGDVDEHVARMTRLAPFAVPFNVTGSPALVMPAGLSADGLPLAVQLAGKLGDDGLILRLAQATEAAFRELFPGQSGTSPLER